MSNKAILEKFNEIYNQTYASVLKYIILHCNNLEDVNDLLQDTYIELYKCLQRKKIKPIEDIEAYIIGITKNIIKKYYRFKYKNNIVQIRENENKEMPIDINIDLESQIITKENVQYVWNYIQNKDIKIAKIFYLYYCVDMKIKDIAHEMNLNESTIKNYIYRTIKELRKNLKKEGNENVRK